MARSRSHRNIDIGRLITGAVFTRIRADIPTGVGARIRNANRTCRKSTSATYATQATGPRADKIRAAIEDKVLGLETGADDYLTKPFAFSELLARVQALIRRSSDVSEPTKLMAADVTINLISREVIRAGKTIELQPLEFSLLEYLMRHPENIVSKTSILEQVYDYSFDPQTNVVDVLVCRLRNKIDRDFQQKLIHTVRGMGYVLKSDA